MTARVDHLGRAAAAIAGVSRAPDVEIAAVYAAVARTSLARAREELVRLEAQLANYERELVARWPSAPPPTEGPPR